MSYLIILCAGYSPNNSLGYTQAANLFTPISTNLNINPQQQNGYSNAGMGVLNSNAPGPIGTGGNFIICIKRIGA